MVLRPHRTTTYVDAAYSYRPSSVVCRSVCRSVTLVSHAKTVAPIELPFGLRTWAGPGNHVLDGAPDPPLEEAIFFGGGENGCPIVKYRDILRSSLQSLQTALQTAYVNEDLVSSNQAIQCKSTSSPIGTHWISVIS